MSLKELTVGLSLLVVGCASGDGPIDARQEHLLACEAYASALEQVATWVELGRLDAGQLAALRRIEAAATPQCQGAAPTMAGADLVRQATQAIEDVLVTIIEESA